MVGSHVDQTSAQLGYLMATRPVKPVVLDAGAVVAGAGQGVEAIADRVASGLRMADVVLYTSRELIRASPGPR